MLQLDTKKTLNSSVSLLWAFTSDTRCLNEETHSAAHRTITRSKLILLSPWTDKQHFQIRYLICKSGRGLREKAGILNAKHLQPQINSNHSANKPMRGQAAKFSTIIVGITSEWLSKWAKQIASYFSSISAISLFSRGLISVLNAECCLSSPAPLPEHRRCVFGTSEKSVNAAEECGCLQGRTWPACGVSLCLGSACVWGQPVCGVNRCVGSACVWMAPDSWLNSLEKSGNDYEVWEPFIYPLRVFSSIQSTTYLFIYVFSV